MNIDDLATKRPTVVAHQLIDIYDTNGIPGRQWAALSARYGNVEAREIVVAVSLLRGKERGSYDDVVDLLIADARGNPKPSADTPQGGST